MDKPHVIIIGAGFTGVATAHDLALRGCSVTVVDRGPVANGTSGRTHGLLHSGGRYCVADTEAAIECIDENLLLKKIVPQCIEPNGGLFVALNESDMEFAQAFKKGAEASHIEYEELSPQQALRLEPNLNPKLLGAYLVPDGTFDPLRLAMAFAATAKVNGAKFKLFTEVEEIIIDGRGSVTGIKVWDRTNDKRYEIRGDMVVNATGAWAGEIAHMAGVDVSIRPTPGVMVAYGQRFCERVINRLNKASDGDIILPQRRFMVVGTTSFEIEDKDYVPVYPDHVDKMLERGSELIPGIRNAPERGAYMATRPLIGSTAAGRSISRTFKCYDHEESGGAGCFVTITGGKATTLRLMAEKTADLVCTKLGINMLSQTCDVPLVSYRQYYSIPDDN
jgi:glycerol-3-phosphate dehydrogenase